MLPYSTSFGAAFGYVPLGVVFAMAGGAYLRAKNGAMALASKHLRKSLGAVVSKVGGPSSPHEDTHTSSLPHVFSTSSMSVSVSSSAAGFNGYGTIFVFGWTGLIVLGRSSGWS